MSTPKPTTRDRGRAWRKLRARVLSACPVCVSCASLGIAREAREVDHIVPLFRGGTDAIENLQPLCPECHADKGRSDLGLPARSAVGVDGAPISPAHHWSPRGAVKTLERLVMDTGSATQNSANRKCEVTL